MLLSAVGLFGFVVRAFDLTLSDFLFEVVTAYREIFHPIVEFLFSPLPWTLSETQKDALLVYVAVGSATSRTYWNEVAETERIAKFPARISPWYRWRTLWLALVSILAWPITWVLLFAQPYFYVQKSEEGRFRFAGRWPSRFAGSNLEIKYDMRIVLLTQVLAVCAVVAVLTLFTVVGIE